MATNITIHGIELDAQTRCAHWHSLLDIVAIRMKCCDLFYACKDCHDALAGHALQPWPQSEWDEVTIRCGACRHLMTTRDYLDGANACPSCRAAFNPDCRHHHHFYFDMTPEL
jgi:uncharacterized CHY-type Zn-finger protein